MNGWVAYVQSSTLHIASPDGSATVNDLAIGDVSCPTFAPVGSLLAYRQDGNLVFAAIGERATIGAQLAVPAPWVPVGECPIWSPDGRAVAQATREAVEIISIDGSRRRIQLPGRGWSRSIAWTYDGSSIVAARGSEILLVPLDGGEPQVVFETETRAYGDQDYYATLESSPVGPYLAAIISSCDKEPATDEAGPSCMRGMDYNGNVLFAEPLEPGPPTVAWAPDGQRLAWFDQEGIRVRSIDAAESHLIPLERQVDGAGGPVVVDTTQSLAWSPDGTRLLCEVSYTGERHEHAIVSVAADGSGDVIVHSGWQTETALLRQGDLAWQRR